MFERPRATWNRKQVVGVGVCAGLLILFLALSLTRLVLGVRQVSGVVLSSGPTSVAGVHGGTREVASIQLSNGRIVSALVIKGGGPLSLGSEVTLLESSHLWASTSYEVVSQGR